MCAILALVSRKMVVSLLDRRKLSREKFERGIDGETIIGYTELATHGATEF